MSINVIDLSDVDDIDLSDFEALERQMESENRGSVFWPDDVGNIKLLDFTIEDDCVSIKLTSEGKALYGNKSFDHKDFIDEITFAHYLGLQAETLTDLERRIEQASGYRVVNPDGVLQAAMKEGRLNVVRGNQAPEINSGGLSKAQLVSADYSDLPEKAHRNTVRFGSRSVASIYIDRGDRYDPYMVKFAPLNQPASKHSKESTMMAFEYAALRALKMHGIKAVDARLLKTSDGQSYLVTERFDGKSFSKSGVPNSYTMFSPMSWLSTVTTGTFNPLTQSQATKRLLDISSKQSELLDEVMTRYCFDKLIGNADGHGFNVGTITRVDNGKVRRTLAPAFDVTPYLMDQNNPEAARHFGVDGIVLSEATVDEFAKKDALFNEYRKSHPDVVRGAFEKAEAARVTMIHIIEHELVAEGIISSHDAQKFNNYLNSPVGMNTEMSASAEIINPLTRGNQSTIDKFRNKAIKKDHDVDEKCNQGL